MTALAGPGIEEAGRPASPILRMRGLAKRFGQLRVLTGVDLDVQAGEFLALVGENGAGKSTIVRCIAGVLTPDAGALVLGGEGSGSGLGDLHGRGIAVVWQDLALCDNLDTVANLFLGREIGRVILSDAEMHVEASNMLAELGIHIDDLRRPVGMLSGGQRQSIALARAMIGRPKLLILDEPTAALGVAETASVVRLIRRLRATGTTIILVSHDLELVFELAERIAVLRQGRIVTTVSPRDVHPDDVVALMSGAAVDSMARTQLHRLQSLVDQLPETDPAASLPLIMSAMASALGQDRLCVHLREEDDAGSGMLRLVAAVGLAAPLLDMIQVLPVGDLGGPAGLAAVADQVVVVEDTRSDRRVGLLRPAAMAAGVLSAWAAPVAGSGGVIGTITGYGDAVGRPSDDQLQLVSLYASHAASAIERDRLLDEATRRNRVLETLREMLDILAGPEQLQGGLAVAVRSLCRGLGAGAVAVHDEVRDETGPDHPRRRLTVTPEDDEPDPGVVDELGVAAHSVLATGARPGAVVAVGPSVLVTVLDGPDGRSVLSVWWPDPRRSGADAVELLSDAAHSLHLAIEREALLESQQEAAALRRSNSMQRQFLSRLSHELRTPLTAIEGYVSTLRQPDVTWDASSQTRFLDRIGTESARLVRLVGDLLDSSAVESGILRIHPDWCELSLVLEAAVSCLPPTAAVTLRCDPDLAPIWADHDRLEQLFVNLIENALRHTPEGTVVTVHARPGGPGAVVIDVIDDGPGIPPDLAGRVFLPHERGTTSAPGAGLGLAIAKGIVDAHRGVLTLRSSPVGTWFEVSLPIDPVDGEVSGLPA